MRPALDPDASGAAPHPSRGRGRGCEVWLLRVPDEGADTQAPAWSTVFVEARVELVIAREGDAFARALAPALGALELALRDLPADLQSAARSAWGAVEARLATGARCLLVVLEGPLLQAVVAHALGMPPERATALRVDPGRLVLLRDDARGIVLRRSNVVAPEAQAGTELPWSGGAAR